VALATSLTLAFNGGLDILVTQLNEIVLAKRAVTADTALRLARFFGTSDRFWLNLQAAYDLDVERDRLAGRLAKSRSVMRARPCAPTGPSSSVLQARARPSQGMP
jgi:addiction module HigA family antidote